MNALELIQEAARRLLIMIPKSPLFPSAPNVIDDGSDIDYDKNLLISCLNAVIKQNMTLNLFNRQILPKSVSLWDDNAVYFLNNYVDKNPIYSDFVVNLSQVCPELEELLGDGFNVSVYELYEPTFYKKKSFLFRQLTPNDYLRLKKTCLPNPNPSENLMRQNESNFSNFKLLRKDYKDYKRNMPSEDKTYMLNAANLESGFIILGDANTNKIAYFCNNMLLDKDIAAISNTISYGQGYSQPPTLEFLYRTNYGVITAMGERVATITADTDTLVINDELAVLGTIVNYKSYYGIDYTLDLGQYKQMIDQLKENQENIQITHLDKKQYFPIRNK
jgi:hypothetical protein